VVKILRIQMVFTRKNLDWWCLRGLVALVMALVVFAPLAFGSVDPWALLVVLGLASGVATLWVVRLWLSRKPKLLWPPLAWAVLAFVLYALGRYLTADIEYVARWEWLQVLVFAFLFLALVNNLHGQAEMEAVSYTLIAVATGIAGYAVLQLLNHSANVWNVVAPGAGRASGTYISPNHLAGLLAMVLPLALAFLLVGRVGIIARVLLGYALLALAAGLAVTFSRGGWVAGGAGILFVLGVLIFHANHRLKAILLLLGLLLGGAVFVTGYLSKTTGYMHRVKSPDAAGPGVVDLSSRAMMWQGALAMWADHFWLGVGPAHYDYRFRQYRPEPMQLRPDRAHNDYLNLLADWGAVGGAIVFSGVGILIFSLRKTWPHVRREENSFGTGQSNRFAFFLGATGGLVALLVHSVVDFDLHIPANALVGVTLLGLLASNVRFATERHWRHAGGPLKTVLTVVLLGGVAYVAVQEWRLAGEVRWLARAEALPNFSPERAEALTQAHACEPKNFQTAYDIGECFRTQSLDGGSDYEEKAMRAMNWYALALRTNPWDGYSYLRTGMCLDWLGKYREAEPFFSQAEQRDPNGYYMVANIGWHYVQIGDYALARQWFLRSRKLDSQHNDIARNYLAICEQKLAEKASGRPTFPAGF
jgi:O-antigen ligase